MECKVYIWYTVNIKLMNVRFFKYKKKHTKDNFVRTILFFLINRIFSLTKDKLLNLLNVCVNEYIYIYDEMLTSSFNPFFFKHLLVLVQQVALGLNHNVILGNC